MKKYCRICEKDVNSYNFHIKRHHNMTIQEYNEKYIPKKICIVCKKEFRSNKEQQIYCCLDCRDQAYSDQKITESRKNPGDRVECKICGFMGIKLVSHLKDKHNMTLKEYQDKFNLSTADCHAASYLKFCSEKIKGDKNPGYNHGGRLSPFSKKFFKYTNPEEQVNQIIKKVKQTKQDNPQNNSTRIEHWMAKGLTKSEAKEKVIERQKTFSLEICIKKYGETEGLIRWQARQEKWLQTLSMKSEKERSEINKKKVTKGNGSISKAETELYLILKDEFDLVQQYTLFEKRSFLFDIVNIKQKKIIEYNGAWWHCDQRKYAPDYIHPKKKKTAAEIWQDDEYKISVAKNQGWQVLVINELDYKKQKKQIIEICKGFLNE